MRTRQCINFLSDLVGEAKRKFENCTIILAGDFNQWQIADITADHSDLTEADHGPTRADRKIDRVFLNFWRSVEICQTLAPLESVETPSDHKMVFIQAAFARTSFTKISYTYRRVTDQGAAKFDELMCQQAWTAVYTAVGCDAKATALADILNKLMDDSIPFKTTTQLF